MRSAALETDSVRPLSQFLVCLFFLLNALLQKRAALFFRAIDR